MENNNVEEDYNVEIDVSETLYLSQKSENYLMQAITGLVQEEIVEAVHDLMSRRCAYKNITFTLRIAR